MECTSCQTPLTGGLDTFGEIHFPLCRSCFFDQNETAPQYETMHIVKLNGKGKIVEESLERVRVK